MKAFSLLIALLLVVSSCAPRVQVDARRGINFNKYKTYAWMDPDIKAGQNPVYYNEIATQNVEDALNATLAERGLRLDQNNPDLLIGYHFFVENRTRTVADPSPMYGPFMGWGRWGWNGWGPAWWGWNGARQYRTEQYRSGTVVVDMVDARTRKLVWRGSVQDAITNPSRIGPELTREVNRILERFPARRS